MKSKPFRTSALCLLFLLFAHTSAMAALTPPELLREFDVLIQNRDTRKIIELVALNLEPARQLLAELEEKGRGESAEAGKAKAYAEILSTVIQEFDKLELGSNEIRKLAEQGQKAFDAEDFAEALRNWESGLRMAEESVDLRASFQFLTAIADVYTRQDRYKEALDSYDKAATIGMALGENSLQSLVLSGKGTVHLKKGDYEQALEYYKQSLAMDDENGRPEVKCLTLRTISGALAARGLAKEALEYSEQALALARDLGNEELESDTLSEIGSLRASLGEYAGALECYDRALPIARKIQNRQMEGLILGRFGDLFLLQCRYEKALEQLEQMRSIAREIGNRMLELLALQKTGTVRWNLGDYENALLAYEEGLAIAGQLGAPGREADFLDLRAVAYTALKQQETALRLFREEQEIGVRIGNKNIQGTALLGIGTAYWDSGQYEKALEAFEKALPLHESTGDLNFTSLALNGIGQLNWHLGRFEKAAEVLERSLQKNSETGSRDWEAATLIDLAKTYASLGRQEKALETSQKSLDLSRDVGALDLLWRALDGLATLEAGADRYARAIDRYEEALGVVESIRSELSLQESRQFFMQNRLEVYDNFIALLQKMHAKDPSAGYDRRSMEIFERKQGRVFLEEMGKSRARNFAGLPDDLRLKEAEIENGLAGSRADLASEKSQPAGKQNSERLRAVQTTMERLQAEQAKLREELKRKHPDYYALKYPMPASVSELQGTVLGPGEVILAYGVTREVTYLWMIGKDVFRSFVIPIGDRELDARVKEFRKGPTAIGDSLQNLGQVTYAVMESSLERIRQKGRELYELLVPEAARKELDRAGTIYIVPTECLYALPFEALTTGPQGGGSQPRFLIEDHPVAYLSSASLLRTIREAKPGRGQEPRFPLLAFAHPDYGAQTDAAEETKSRSARTAADGGAPRSRGFSVSREEPADSRTTPSETGPAAGTPAENREERSKGLADRAYKEILGGEFVELPETEAEVREISSALKAPEESLPLQLGKAASRSRVLELSRSDRLRDYRYIVFACHAILPGVVNGITQSALVLSHPDPDTRQDGFLTAADVYGLKLNAKMVTLSACNTGRGQATRGEGIMGLTRAFMFAGTPAISVTLWPVESLSMKTLNSGYFERLSQGKPPAEALREVKLRMLRGEQNEGYRNPFFWAPMVLFGDGR